ncbi:thioredoxin domain-containing protein [Herbiconiux sp. L3-i23]|uniref:DsbA family protein n=1 Tax=Herbiconiux sp. L3-i23 TaxID=2905871 RepID=UPI00204A69E8|nr:thioredoxin domain-containing protein [Herbiconiux sp. L3-i23]BDI21257.1 hypothetical protein L3i23_00330 [Herbiconiux sp. L3-i23]
MNTTQNTSRTRRIIYLVAGLVAAAAIAVVIAIVVNTTARTAALTETDGPAQVLRDDTHRLDVAENGEVTLVEFLDFECEACGAFYPFVEELRARYDGQITFAVRYFPIPSHKNSENAAIAAQAASEQGQFEAMYERLFETQTQWAEKQDSQAAVFRTYAQELGLDMTDYDAAVADPDTQARVQSDFADGIELGVEGTPSFFLNGERLEPESAQDFVDAIDAALAQ